MTWTISYCKACGRQIEWVFEDGKKVARNFDGLGKTGPVHMSTCTNPDYFKKESKPSERPMTKARRELLKNPWWAK